MVSFAKIDVDMMASKWNENIPAVAHGPTLHFPLSQWLTKRKRP